MKPLIVANWKCNPTTIKEAKELFDSVKKGIKNIKKAEVVICPPFLYLKELKEPSSLKKRNSVPLVGAQNCFWEQKGAYTGEISPSMLRDFECKYVIIGHSERRKYFGETDKMINKKLKAALREKINPILCIGETKEEREQGMTESVLKRQLACGLEDISKTRFPQIVFAYEPIWAIGTGKACDVEEAQKMGLLIRKIISKNARVLYGGSVNSKNAVEYIKEAGLGGLLVGGASLDAKEFIKIVKSVI